MMELVRDWIDRAGGRAHVAAELGVSVGALGHWCTGLRRPSIHYLLRLSQLANVSPSEWDHAVKQLARREAA